MDGITSEFGQSAWIPMLAVFTVGVGAMVWGRRQAGVIALSFLDKYSHHVVPRQRGAWRAGLIGLVLLAGLGLKAALDPGTHRVLSLAGLLPFLFATVNEFHLARGQKGEIRHLQEWRKRRYGDAAGLALLPLLVSIQLSALAAHLLGAVAAGWLGWLALVAILGHRQPGSARAGFRLAATTTERVGRAGPRALLACSTVIAVAIAWCTWPFTYSSTVGIPLGGATSATVVLYFLARPCTPLRVAIESGRGRVSPGQARAARYLLVAGCGTGLLTAAIARWGFDPLWKQALVATGVSLGLAWLVHDRCSIDPLELLRRNFAAPPPRRRSRPFADRNAADRSAGDGTLLTLLAGVAVSAAVLMVAKGEPELLVPTLAFVGQFVALGFVLGELPLEWLGVWLRSVGWRVDERSSDGYRRLGGLLGALGAGVAALGLLGRGEPLPLYELTIAMIGVAVLASACAPRAARTLPVKWRRATPLLAAGVVAFVASLEHWPVLAIVPASLVAGAAIGLVLVWGAECYPVKEMLRPVFAWAALAREADERLVAGRKLIRFGLLLGSIGGAIVTLRAFSGQWTDPAWAPAALLGAGVAAVTGLVFLTLRRQVAKRLWSGLRKEAVAPLGRELRDASRALLVATLPPAAIAAAGTLPVAMRLVEHRPAAALVAAAIALALLAHLGALRREPGGWLRAAHVHVDRASRGGEMRAKPTEIPALIKDAIGQGKHWGIVPVWVAVILAAMVLGLAGWLISLL